MWDTSSSTLAFKTMLFSSFSASVKLSQSNSTECESGKPRLLSPRLAKNFYDAGTEDQAVQHQCDPTDVGSAWWWRFKALGLRTHHIIVKLCTRNASPKKGMGEKPGNEDKPNWTSGK
jgi:hypothetical protein